MSKTVYKRMARKSKKPFTAAVAVTLAAALLVGGAFAWTDFTQSRTNKFHGTFDADVTLHDEFDGEDKDVFVENTGTNPIYVRVRLDEFMQVGETVFDPDADIHDKSTWKPHTYQLGDDIEDCEHIKSNGCLFHDYYRWSMTGAERLYNPGTPGMVYATLDADGKVDTTSGTLTTAAQANHILLSDAVDALNAVTPTPDQQTILNAMETGCWLLDDTAGAKDGGGWAYWSKALAPMSFNPDGTVEEYGDATNLLLDKVELAKEPESDWIYRIDVKLQAVTLGDTGLWHDDTSVCGYKLTDAANTLIEHWNA